MIKKIWRSIQRLRWWHIIPTILVLSIAYFLSNIFLNYSSPPACIMDSPLIYGLGGVVGVLLLLTFFTYSSEVRIVWHTIKRYNILFPILTILFLGIYSVSLLKTRDPSFEMLLTPGTLFIVIIGTISVFGLFFTISKLEEIHGRLLRYPHLIERCEILVRDELKRAERGKPSRLIIMANAPCFGNISAHREFDLYKDKLKKVLVHENVRVHLVSLPLIGGNSSLNRFYKERWKDRDPEVLKKRIMENKTLIQIVLKSNSETEAEKKVYAIDISKVKEVPFHLFMTSERAILFTTLSFPGKIVARNQRVEIVGFETGDDAIMSTLEKGFFNRVDTVAKSYPTD